MTQNTQRGSLVRVRFAPSPTGYVHVGSLRTALYNYLFARRNGGTLVLRIEDTDQKRYVDGAVENLLDAMSWAGITFDEGPVQGGPCGPYYQSRRTAIYREHCGDLVARGLVYPCFCTPERLEQVRRERTKANDPNQRYDGFCRDLDPAETAGRISSGESHVVRLAMPRGEKISWNDAIRGEVTFDSNLIDDQVLIKSDGFPTYHLANVVDDHLMEITHVIRGEEWVSSTPKHIVLYRAFGWEPPVFAHLPLLLNPDRSKLSKRQGDVAVEDYRRKGYLPAALVNFIGLLGWSPGNEREFLTSGEMAAEFDLTRVSKSGSIFDIQKLDFINEHYMKAVSASDKAAMCVPFLVEAGMTTEAELKTRLGWLEKVVDFCGERIKKPADIVGCTSFLFKNFEDYEEKSAVKHFYRADALEALKKALKVIETAEPFEHGTIGVALTAFAETEGLKLGKVLQPLRIACTGVGVSFGMFEVIEALGRDVVVSRVGAAIEKISSRLENNGE